MRRQWGVRDRRTGEVWRSITFAVAQDVANKESARLELVVRFDGGEWVALEWFVYPGYQPAPPPRAARRTAFYEWQGRRHPNKLSRWLYGQMGRVYGGVQQLFRRHGA